MPKGLKKLLNMLSGMFRGMSVDYVVVELRELENVFALIILGSFVGIPSPPTPIALRLLPYMARELLIMQRISSRLDDMLAEMAGLFEVT